MEGVGQEGEGDEGKTGGRMEGRGSWRRREQEGREGVGGGERGKAMGERGARGKVGDGIGRERNEGGWG